MRIVLCLVLLCAAFGCGKTERVPARSIQELSSVAVPPPPDVGDVNNFQACKATPRRTLSQSEACRIEALRKRCLPADDCLVTCMSSPDVERLVGGCEHVCFSYLHAMPPPPEGLAYCDKN